MKIKNFINIKANGKSIDFHNLILDEYLKRFIRSQLNIEDSNTVKNGKKMQILYLKFDTELDFDATSEINAFESFDAIMFLSSFTQKISERQIEAKYIFDAKLGLQDLASHQTVEMSYYNGRKITAIGFNEMPGIPKIAGPVCAIVDTSKYNLYMQGGQDFILTRRDVISSDVDFWSNDSRIKGPIHLTVKGGPSLLYQDPLYEYEDEEVGGHGSYVTPDPTYSQLYSIGFSSYKESIAEEYILGTDITAVNNGTSISIDGLQTKMKQYTYCPLQSIFPFSGLFPLKPSYKYVVFKYKLFQTIYTRNPDYVEGGDESEFIGTWTDTGAYYLQAVSLSKYGKTNLTIKYERGN